MQPLHSPGESEGKQDKNLMGFHDSTAVWMRCSLFWVVTQHTLAVIYQHFGTERLPQNTDKQLKTYTA
jgi:uncharacterized protein YifN (PemK superfamily)